MPAIWHGLVWLPLALAAYALASMYWSHTYLAGVELVRWCILSLLLWLGLNTLNHKNVPTLIWGIHGGAVVASVWAALQFWFDLTIFPQGAAPASTFVNRNFFAEYVVCTLPLSIWLLANMRFGRWVYWMAASVALNVAAILMSGTRSALVAMLVLLPICAFTLLKYRQQLGFAQWRRVQMVRVVSILLGGIVFLGSVPAKNSQFFQADQGATALLRSLQRATSIAQPAEYSTGSFAVRAVMWKATARMLLAHPLAGVGAGAWEVHIPLYQQAAIGMETDYYAHNEYLQLLGEYGLVVGGLFLAFLLAYLLVSAGKTWRLPDSGLHDAPVRASVLACLLGLLIVSLAGFPLHLASTGALFAVCFAILASSDHRLGIDESFFSTAIHLKPFYFRLGVVLVGCAMVCALYITLQAVKAEQNIVRAIQLGNGAMRARQTGMEPSAERSAQILHKLRDGILIAPHYRKLSSVAADQLAQSGDLVNALWVWESIVASRPYIAVVWASMARGYAQLGQNERALESLRHWQQLQPSAPGLLALEVALLGLTGKISEAEQKLTRAYDLEQYDYELVMTGYALGMKFHRWPLAIRSIELRNRTWPEQSEDGNVMLGLISNFQAALN